MRTPAGAPMPPVWLAYIAVDDVDAEARKVESGGGAIQMPPQDIPGVGRFAFVADPQGALFYLMRELPRAELRLRLGPAARRPCRLERADDQRPRRRAWSFYGKHFGWSKDGAMDMGPMGQYEFIRHGGATAA